MFKNYGCLFVILFLLILINACQQTNSGCIPVKNSSFSLADTDKVKVPFTGKDTFNFVSDSGNILHFFCLGKTDTYQTNIISGASPPGCPKPTMSFEFQNFKYISSDTAFWELDFNLLRAQSPNYYGSNGQFIVNGNETYTSDFNTMINDSAYTDTVTVNGKMFKCITIYADTGDASNAIYYNHNFGVLKVVYPYYRTWYKQ